MFGASQGRLSCRKKYGYLSYKITQILIMEDSKLIITPFYWRYVEPIQSIPLFEAFEMAEKQLLGIINGISEDRGAHRYQPQKWTVKEVLGHIIDVERIMAYRALRFARNDKTPLHGFEENDYAPESNAGGRAISELKDELINLRKTTVDLFQGFTQKMMSRTGTCNNAELSVEALGYIIAGHALHHCRILVERYQVGTQ